MGDGTFDSAFGRYRLLHRLTEGGMAELFLARLTSSASTVRPVVIKRIHPRYGDNATFVSMFIDEARITIGLDHPNIVRMHDFGQVEGSYFMAMEYIEGIDLGVLLKHVLQSGQRVPMAAAITIVMHMLRGLHHAHQLRDHWGEPMRIVHRDVSPQNTMLGANGAIKVTDFGIAAARYKLTLTEAGVVLGKASYMSPEHAYGHVVDARADVWACGVILWELLVGERLFADETPMRTLERVAKQPIIPPSHHRRDVPERIDEIVMSMLERDRTHRCATAGLAGQWLEAELAKMPTYTPDMLASLVRSASQEPSFAPAEPAQDAEVTADTSHVEPSLTASIWADAQMQQHVRAFAADANLWHIIDIGERAMSLAHPKLGVAAFRLCAALFAHRGLPIQSMTAYVLARPHIDDDTARKDWATLVALRPRAQPSAPVDGDQMPTQLAAGTLFGALHRFDADGLWGRMLSLHAELADAPRSSVDVPLLSQLGADELTKLSAIVRTRRVRSGEVVVREGDKGDQLYAIACGRFLVHCQPDKELMTTTPAAASLGDVDDNEWHHAATMRDTSYENLISSSDRVFLSALSDGDFFGEFSFLTGRQRIATVEAIADGIILEVERQDLDAVASSHAEFHAPLLDFYKARVAEIVMAKSPVFSLLSSTVRRQLLGAATVEVVADGQVIVQEGARADAVYLIRRGEVEVFRAEVDGTTIFINKLVAGQFFGEIACATGRLRTSSVRSIDFTELLRIPQAALLQAIQDVPKAHALLDALIAQRTRETQARVKAHRQLFLGS
jgi:eukaryotic-like serine/threonine-protein kinase